MSTEIASIHPHLPTMTTRRLRDGGVVSEEPATVSVSLQTRCPAKWAFVDLETGEIWLHDRDRGFVRASRAHAEMIHQIAEASASP
jgi:hypothetical protein